MTDEHLDWAAGRTPLGRLLKLVDPAPQIVSAVYSEAERGGLEANATTSKREARVVNDGLLYPQHNGISRIGLP